jgi:DNA (cytosine-5)-methyltransferase 1
MANGYSGRSFDTVNITPFLKGKNFPAMAESGWLTRSLEHNQPYDKKYSGSIRPKELKNAFINVIDEIQTNKQNDSILKYILQYLILQRNKFDIQLAKPINLSIADLVSILDNHFSSRYSSEGAARLPSLAFYAIYQCLIIELKRFTNKVLLPLENHTSADARSGRIGDIDIVDENEKPFEAIEIKHGIEITKQLVSDAYSKFHSTSVNRYYILSTAGVKEEETDSILSEIEKIRRIHGCQVIVNGVIGSLQYYLRLLNSINNFVENYVTLLEQDTSIKFEHKLRWNELINRL